MKFTRIILTGVVAAALTLGGAAIGAYAEDAPVPTPTDSVAPPPTDGTVTDETTTPAPTDQPAAPEVSDAVVPTDQPAPEVTVTPTQRVVSWLLAPGSTFADRWKGGDQTYLADATVCGTGLVQQDTWDVSTEAHVSLANSIVASGKLGLVNGSPADSALYVSNVDFAQTPCPPPVITPTECTTNTTLPVATEAAPAGWGDLKNGTWTDGGIQLTATATDEAYAYVDLPTTFKLSTVGSLATVGENATGSFGVILQTPGGQNIHYDADGTFWLVTPGVLPETSTGMYSGTLADLISDPDIYEVAVWVNPGGSLLLKSQAYNCQIQPFFASAAITPVISVTPTTATSLAFTGVEWITWLFAAFAAASIALGVGLKLHHRRMEKRLAA